MKKKRVVKPNNNRKLSSIFILLFFCKSHLVAQLCFELGFVYNQSFLTTFQIQYEFELRCRQHDAPHHEWPEKSWMNRLVSHSNCIVSSFHMPDLTSKRKVWTVSIESLMRVWLYFILYTYMVLPRCTHQWKIYWNPQSTVWVTQHLMDQCSLKLRNQ